MGVPVIKYVKLVIFTHTLKRKLVIECIILLFNSNNQNVELNQ